MRIFGRSASERLTRTLVEATFHMAFNNHQLVTSLIHHSDKESQYSGSSFKDLLRHYGIQVYMKTAGN